MKPTNKQIGYITGYATALQDIMLILTGENANSKSYDPCEIDNEYLHSYAYDLKDGGRHHPLSDYDNIEEIKKLMLNEVYESIVENISKQIKKHLDI